MSMKTVDDLFAQLQALGAGEFAHLDGSLAEHLRGTERLLREWGACETLCIAGLYHAVYGTDGFNSSLRSLTGRKKMAELIGSETEDIVYLFGACNRKVFYPRIGTPAQLIFDDRFSNREYDILPKQLRYLCELVLANELEIAGNSKEFRAQHGAALSKLFERMEGLASKAGLKAYRDMLCR
jgi:hypothetical protein